MEIIPIMETWWFSAERGFCPLGFLSGRAFIRWGFCAVGFLSVGFLSVVFLSASTPNKTCLFLSEIFNMIFQITLLLCSVFQRISALKNNVIGKKMLRNYITLICIIFNYILSRRHMLFRNNWVQNSCKVNQRYL